MIAQYLGHKVIVGLPESRHNFPILCTAVGGLKQPKLAFKYMASLTGKCKGINDVEYLVINEMIDYITDIMIPNIQLIHT